MDKLYTPEEAALELKMSVEYIRRLLRNGELVGSKIGSDWRISEPDLQDFITNHKKHTTSQEAN
jgi:excisionase family DNA binding protein